MDPWLSRLSRLDFQTGLLDFQTGLLDLWTGLLGLSGLPGVTFQAILGPTRPSWTPKCAVFVDWTSSLDFWTFRLHFGLLNWTFWVFLLLAEHAGASVYAMKSAHPDF